MATIGIKIANGEFYAILEESSTVKKRLILTTVHDGQKSVQIDLYKSEARSMADAVYIGSLVVENIKPRPKGEPSIELIVSCNLSGEINADVTDLDSSKGVTGTSHLSVSLKTLEDSSRDLDIPDFELESSEPPPSGLYDRATVVVEKEKESKSPLLTVIIILGILLLLGGAVWYFLLRPSPTESARQTQPQTTTQAPEAQPAPPAPVQPQSREQVPVIQAPSVAPTPSQTQPRSRPPAPVSSYSVPQTIPREGAPYRIRWGDTLWDISEAFYRNPWLYPRIARFNNIRNPDLIIAGTTIRIPPRN